MKMNLEIELDFIGEDYSLEESFESEVKDSIIRKVETQIFNVLKPKIDASFNDAVNNQIEKILADYLSRPVVISNGYKTEEYASALDMIEIKFASLYDEKFRNKKGCDRDPIYERLAENIKMQVSNVISKLDNTIVSEAKKIAAQEVKETALFKALEKIEGKQK